jgi:hypothetical protein
MISRRSLLAAAPAALVLPQAALAAARRPLRLAMPFELVRGAVVVSLMINDQGPFRMTVSPSVQLNSIAEDLPVKLGMRQMDMKMELTGASGQVTETRAYQADKIFIGGRIHEDNVSFIAHPRWAEDIDGALCPWFAGFSAGFDFEHKQFIVLQGGPPTDGFNAVPFVGRRMKAQRSFRQHDDVIHFQTAVRLMGTVDGIPVQLGVDTSLGESVILHSDFVRDNGLWHRYPTGPSGQVKDGDEVVESRQVTLGSLKLGDMTVAAPDTLLMHGPDLGRRGDVVDGYIGTGLLKRYTVWIDWAAGQAYFKLNPSAAA